MPNFVKKFNDMLMAFIMGSKSNFDGVWKDFSYSLERKIDELQSPKISDAFSVVIGVPIMF
jgi:hypothetical protein